MLENYPGADLQLSLGAGHIPRLIFAGAGKWALNLAANLLPFMNTWRVGGLSN